jgi:eukaryotic-like serine/threonine-protein kinase
LTPEFATSLVQSRLFDGERAPRENDLVQAIVKESGGNPYFIRELTAYANKRTCEYPAATDSLTLSSVISAKLGELPEDARRLDIVALCGQPIRNVDAVRAASLHEDSAASIALLRAHEFVRAIGPGSEECFETYHDRIRETILANISPETKKARHASVAYALKPPIEPNQRHWPPISKARANYKKPDDTARWRQTMRLPPWHVNKPKVARFEGGGWGDGKKSRE